MVVHDHAIDEVLPHHCLPFREAVALALQRVEHLEVATRWSGADLPGHSPADPLPSDPDWAGGTMFADVQEAHSAATPEGVFRTVSGIGGRRGWYAANWLWSIRAWNRAVGGIGLRRGPASPDDLRVGDALDFWRVEAYEPSTLLRLRAEMRLPGEAWLEWRIEPHDESDPSAGCTLHQRALFHPKGLWGRLYWYSVLPFHALIFGRLCHALADAAAAAPPVSVDAPLRHQPRPRSAPALGAGRKANTERQRREEQGQRRRRVLLRRPSRPTLAEPSAGSRKPEAGALWPA